MRLPPVIDAALRPPTRAWLGAAITAIALVVSLVPRHHKTFRTRSAPPDGSARPGDRRNGPNDGRCRHAFERGAPFPDELALVAPLALGARLGPGRVSEIAHHGDGWLMVCVRVGSDEVWVLVSRTDGSTPASPVQVGLFSVRAFLSDAPLAVAQAAVRAVAETLRPNAHLPIPSHLGRYIDRAR